MSQKSMDLIARGLGATLLAGSLVLAGTLGVSAEEKNVSEAVGVEVSSAPDSWKVLPKDREVISEAGQDVRSNLEGARGAMNQPETEGDGTAVRVQLEQAKAGLETILDASPGVRIKAQLYSAATRIPVEETSDVVETLAGISQELSGMTTAASAPAVREHVQAAEQYLKNGEKQAAFQELQAADAQVVLGQADVPAADTYYLVNVAIAALANDDPEVAVQALDAASRSFAVFANAFGMVDSKAPATS